MKLNLKKGLLLGTALVAVSVAGQEALAADYTLTTAPSIWGTTAPVNSVAAGDNVDLDANDLTVNDTDNTAIGAITDTNATPTGNVVFDSNAGDNAGLTISVGSIVIGSGNITVQATENTASANGDATAVTVSGDVTTTGNLAVTAGTNANNTSGAGDDAALTIGGNVSATTITIADGSSGDATLVLNGSSAQTVAGTITGGGDINVTNTSTSGVTFTGANTGTGTITVNNNGNNQAVTFTGDVSSVISLGDNSGTDTIIATFGGSSATTVSGAITGGASENIAVNFAGGDTVTVSAAVTGADTTSITGNTTVTTNSNFNSDAITVASGSTLVTTANTITGAIANSGTLTMGGGDITGNVTGSGDLNVTVDGTLTGSVANTVTISDNVTLTVDGTTGNEEISGNVVINDSGVDDGLAINDQTNTITVSGNVTTGTDGQGLITISDSNGGTVAFTGDVGTSAAKVGVLAVGGGNNQTVTTTGNLFVDAITLDDLDVLQFLGTSAQTVSGTIVGVGANDGIITVGNGTTTSDVTFDGIIGTGAGADINTVNVLANATARFNANVTADGAYTNSAGATTIVGVGAIVEAASFTDSGTYTLKANDADGTLASADFGSLTDTGGGGTLTASNITIDVTGDMTEGTVRLLTGINVSATAVSVDDNSYQYSFSVVDNSADTDITVSRKTINSMATTTTNANIGTVLEANTTSTNTQIAAVIDNVADAVDQSAVNEVLEAVAPTVDAGAIVAANTVSNQAISLVNDRLAALRDGSAETGMVAGDMAQGLKAWGQVFGKKANMDQRDGIDGFDAKTLGFAVGLDTSNISDNATVGLAFSYGNTNVDSENATKTDTEVDSYQLTVYGDVDIDNRTFVTGYAAYAWNDIDQTRYNVGGVSGLNANSDTDSDQFAIGAAIGRDYNTRQGFVVTPSLSVDYTNISTDGYTETGAGGANLTVDTEDFDVLKMGIGVETSWEVEQEDGSIFKPSLRAGYSYDLIGDEVETTSSLEGISGTSFKSRGADAERSEFSLGAGVTYFSTDNWEFTANYDFEAKSSYDAHSGYLKAAYRF